MPSLPPVSAKVIADAEQFVQEFKRAERAAKGSAEGIDREVGALVTKLSKKFQLADVGKDILKGAGLFGGFEIARTIAEKISDHFRDAAEHAKTISSEIEKQLSATERLLALRRTDDQNLEEMQKKQLRLAREVSALVGPHEVGRMGRSQRMVMRDATDAEREEAARKTTEMKNLAVDIEQAEQAKKKRQLDQLVSDAKARGGVNMASWKEITPEDEARAAEELRKWNDELTRQADALIALGNPLKEYEDRITEINDLMKLGRLTDDQAWAAKVKTWSDIAELANKGNAGKGTLADLKEVLDVSPPLEKATEAAKELGLTFSSAFEDAIVGGGNLRDVLHGLEQDILRIAVRKSVTEPLGNALGGFFASGASKLFGFATGGDFTVGGGGGTDTTPVAFMATPGERVSVRTPGQQGGDGGSGITLHMTNNFAAGVQRQELVPVLAAWADGIVNKIADKVQRGGGYRRAMA